MGQVGQVLETRLISGLKRTVRIRLTDGYVDAHESVSDVATYDNEIAEVPPWFDLRIDRTQALWAAALRDAAGPLSAHYSGFRA